MTRSTSSIIVLEKTLAVPSLFLLDPFLSFLDGKSLVPANNARIEVEHGPSLARSMFDHFSLVFL